MNNYVLKWRGGAKADGDNTETRIWLVGPFASDGEAARWAQINQKIDGDDPRWQLVILYGAEDKPSIETAIRKPDDPSA